MAEKKASTEVVYSGGKDRPSDFRDPNEVTIHPTPAELDPRNTEAHYRSPEHQTVWDVPPEVLAGGTSEPFDPETYPNPPEPVPQSTATPFKAKEQTDAD